MIDLDSLIPGSKYFRWTEALYLPCWKIHGYPTPEVYKNIITTANQVADPIRELFDKPMLITSWWRPHNYNEWGTVNGVNYGVNGAKASQHTLGKAIDFIIYNVTLEEIHNVLPKKLESLKIRMEQPDNKPRIHCDWANVPPGGFRYFKA